MKKRVRQLLVFVVYYHDFIRKHSELVKPLTDLLKGETKQKKIHWTNECDRALTRIKEIFMTEPIFMSLNINYSFTLSTDCSAVGMGYSIKGGGGKNSPSYLLWYSQTYRHGA